MNIIKTLAVASTALVAVGSANAAVTVTSPDGTNELRLGNQIVIANDFDQNDLFESAAFTDTGSFTTGNDGATVFADVTFNGNLAPAFVADLVGVFTINGNDQTITFTDSGGFLLGSGGGNNIFPNLDLPANSTVTFTITGTVEENFSNADYDIVLSAIPVPAAATFLLTGLAVAGAARLRKKA